MNNKLNELITILQKQVSSNPKNNMKRVSKAIKFFNLDFSKSKLIHVAGTNGKGSVCKYLTQILVDNNYTVGTFVSPYLIKFNERFLVNNEMIKDDILEEYISKVLSYNDTLFEKMSFFELITIMTLIYFYDLKLDVIIMETGIGGKLDVTNTLNYDVSLLTNAGSDHLDKLGPTLNDVLLNKLGILKPNGYLIHTLNEDQLDIANNYALEVNGKIKHLTTPRKILNNPLMFEYKEHIFELQMLGDFQLDNAELAIEAINYLFPEIKMESIANSLKKAKWAGRLDIISTNPYIIVDAAHNKEAAVALTTSLKTLYPNKNITTIMSILGDKDFKGFIDEIHKLRGRIILTSFPDHRLANLEKIADYFTDIEYLKDFKLAVKEIKNDDQVYLITGSIHFIGYFLNNYIK